LEKKYFSVKKTFWGAVTAAMLFTSGNLMAAENGFIGVEVKYHGIEAQDPGTRKSFDDDTVALGLRIGAQNDDFRATLMYDVVDDSEENGGDISQYLILASVDYKIPIESQSFHPFFGACLGYSEYEFDSHSEDDFVYGAEAGLIFSLNPKIDIDVFARYLWPNHDTVDDYVQAGAGLNYKF